jgi:hypothetical protein
MGVGVGVEVGDQQFAPTWTGLDHREQIGAVTFVGELPEDVAEAVGRAGAERAGFGTDKGTGQLSSMQAGLVFWFAGLSGESAGETQGQAGGRWQIKGPDKGTGQLSSS